MPDRTKKDCVVMDICRLNCITVPDAYPVFSQTDILADICRSMYISTVDCALFFHQ